MNINGQISLQFVILIAVVLIILFAFTVVINTVSTIHTIAVATGVFIFIISFASTEIALYILIFSMLLSPEFIVGATQEATLGRGVTLRFDDFLLAVIGLSWLAKMAIKKELGLFLRTPLNKPIAYYISICFVSTMFGVLFERVHLNTGFFFVLKYFEYIIIYFMVVNHIESKNQINRYLGTMLVTCAIVSIIGIAQIPGGGRVSAPFEGAGGEPNTFGGYLIFMIAITMGLLLTSPSFRRKIFYSLIVLLFTIPLLYTQSRGSYVAAIPTIVTFVCLSEKRKWIMIAVVLIAISLPFFAPAPVKERVAFTFIQGKKYREAVKVGAVTLDTSTSARLMSWESASRDWIQHPLLGFGVTGYPFADAQYVKVMMESGFIGLSTFFLLIITIFRQVKRVFQGATEPVYRGLSMGFLAGFVGLLFHSLSANTFIIVRIMEPFWFMLAMVIMIPEIEADK